MSNVIQLKGRSSGRKSRPLPDGMTAQIMIFNGVRVERLSDEAAAAAAVSSRRLPASNNQAIAEDWD